MDLRSSKVGTFQSKKEPAASSSTERTEEKLKQDSATDETRQILDPTSERSKSTRKNRKEHSDNEDPTTVEAMKKSSLKQTATGTRIVTPKSTRKMSPAAKLLRKHHGYKTKIKSLKASLSKSNETMKTLKGFVSDYMKVNKEALTTIQKRVQSDEECLATLKKQNADLQKQLGSSKTAMAREKARSKETKSALCAQQTRFTHDMCLMSLQLEQRSLEMTKLESENKRLQMQLATFTRRGNETDEQEKQSADIGSAKKPAPEDSSSSTLMDRIEGLSDMVWLLQRNCEKSTNKILSELTRRKSRCVSDSRTSSKTPTSDETPYQILIHSAGYSEPFSFLVSGHLKASLAQLRETMYIQLSSSHYLTKLGTEWSFVDPFTSNNVLIENEATTLVQYACGVHPSVDAGDQATLKLFVQ